ncbi:MAG TPA: glycosyltransferase family 39 protein [Candidatus Anoxymicrobiaceae bacterium]
MFKMNRKTLVLALLAIVALMVLLRVFNIGHVLGYDEAWNANSVIDAATGHTGDVFYGNFLRHPPLYTGLGTVYAMITDTGRMGLSIAMEMISLIFSVGLVIVIFFCARDWFDDLTALSAAFLFAVAPAARVFDTLSKQESMTLFFGMCFLLLFFRRKFLFSGVFLGLSMLTKEIFIFLPAALFLFLLVGRRTRDMKGFFESLGTGVLMSFWWYLFVSRSRGEFFQFFLGRSQESLNWRQPWHYYLGRIPLDMGWVTVVLAVAGLAFLVVHIRRSGWPRAVRAAREDAEDEGERAAVSKGAHWEREYLGVSRSYEMALLPVVWILFIYLFLSVSLGKPPWLIYAAIPAFALLGGWGLSQTATALSGRPRIAAVLVVVALAVALAFSIPVGFGAYLRKADPTYGHSLTYKSAADYMNGRMSSSGRVMIRLNDFTPNIAFYLKSYKPDSIAELPSDPSRGDRTLTGNSTVVISGRDATVNEVAGHVLNAHPDFLMIRPGFTGADGYDPALVLARFAQPVKIDGVWVFDGHALASALQAAGNR